MQCMVPCLMVYFVLFMSACKGNVAIETMWSKLKQENEKKASQLEQKCLSLRVSEHLAWLCVCWGRGGGRH